MTDVAPGDRDGSPVHDAGAQPPFPPRVRIICRRRDGAVLLLRWRDPVSGRVFWEPAGGGLEPGETPHDAAARELYEETGLSPTIEDRFSLVSREYIWADRHFAHTEAFFAAVVEDPAIAPTALTSEEIESFLEARFVHPTALEALPDPIEPPDLRAVLQRI
jgi:8-oxo-dGTP pyrophosphatase MutT (NUDIX family)